MNVQTRVVLVAGALLTGWAAPSGAQDAVADVRWLAFVGCWESIDAAQDRLCVTPDGSTVELVTIDGRERIPAPGERGPTTRDGCTGWESAEWSAQGQRVYLRTESECAGRVRRASSGLFAMLSRTEWLRVHAVTVAGQAAVRVVRYRLAAAESPAARDARMAAAAPIAVGDVIEASRHVDASVVEAWVAERAQAFVLDGRQLVALADAGVPDPVIDVMVALTYPGAFARSVGGTPYLETGVGGPIGMTDPLCYGRFASYDYWGYGCAQFGYGLGGWYPDRYPVIIVRQGGGGGSGGTAGARGHGRVVNGRGYVQGETATGKASPRPSTNPSTPASTSRGSTGSSGTSSKSGASEGRTAKPRPQN